MEEEFVEQMCTQIIALKPDLVITEKGVSDLAQHFLVRAGVTVLRRVRKSDNNRIARAVGATVVSRPDELTERDLGLACGLFEVQKIGDEYFTFLTECVDPKACTILLRGASKDILNEVERNLQDAMNVARNVMVDARLVAGGGAVEMALAQVRGGGGGGWSGRRGDGSGTGEGGGRRGLEGAPWRLLWHRCGGRAEGAGAGAREMALAQVSGEGRGEGGGRMEGEWMLTLADTDAS